MRNRRRFSKVLVMIILIPVVMLSAAYVTIHVLIRDKTIREQEETRVNSNCLQVQAFATELWDPETGYPDIGQQRDYWNYAGRQLPQDPVTKKLVALVDREAKAPGEVGYEALKDTSGHNYGYRITGLIRGKLVVMLRYSPPDASGLSLYPSLF